MLAVPPELLIAIFEHLDFDSQVRAYKVCTLWRNLVPKSKLLHSRRYFQADIGPGIHRLVGMDDQDSRLECTLVNGKVVGYTRTHVSVDHAHVDAQSDLDITDCPFLDEAFYSPFDKPRIRPEEESARYTRIEMVAMTRLFVYSSFSVNEDVNFEKRIELVTVRELVEGFVEALIGKVTANLTLLPDTSYRILFEITEDEGEDTVMGYIYPPESLQAKYPKDSEVVATEARAEEVALQPEVT